MGSLDFREEPSEKRILLQVLEVSETKDGRVMSEEKDEKKGYILPDKFRFPPLNDPKAVAVIYEKKESLITEMLGKRSEETGTPMIKLIWGDLVKLKRLNPIWWADGTPGCPACGHECRFVMDDATTVLGYYTCANIECVNNAVQCQDKGQERPIG